METKYQIIIALLILSVGFIVYDQFNEFLLNERLVFYNLGFEDGKEEWNFEVINTVNSKGNLPYFYFDDKTNETIEDFISLVNLCENFK